MAQFPLWCQGATRADKMGFVSSDNSWRRGETTGPETGAVLIGFFTRQCQILAELVATAAHSLRLGGEQPRREDVLLRDVRHLLLHFEETKEQNCCDSAVTM